MRSGSSRTFIGSVLAVDLVGYSKRTVDEQINTKEAFNHLLVQALAQVRPEERIILDTGDGAAIAFLGDPDVCLAVGLELRDRLMEEAEKLGARAGEGPVRIGMNLGSLKVTMDLNGRPNVIGDVLNTAERVMAFAQPGQIVATRSFHEMVSRLSAAHAAMFHPEGNHTDRNGREHEIYIVEDPQRVRRAAAARTAARRAAQAAHETAATSPGTRASPGPALLRNPLKSGMAATALIALIAAGAWVLGRKSADNPAAVIAASPAPVVPAKELPAPTKSEPAAPTPAAPVAKPEAPAANARAPQRKEPPTAETTAPREPPAKSEPPKKAAPEHGKFKSLLYATRDQFNSAVSAVRGPTQAAATATAGAPITRTPPQFPPAAAQQGLESGRVRARLAINADGRVTGVAILSSSARLFEREAIRALEQWRFETGVGNRSYEVDVEFKR
jgi:TonB family protein